MKIAKSLMIACSLLALAACDSSNEKNKEFTLQVLHASPDAPPG